MGSSNRYCATGSSIKIKNRNNTLITNLTDITNDISLNISGNILE